MPETPEDFVDSVFVSFRAQDYNPFPIPGCNWVKEFEEDDIDGTLGDPIASGYEPTWMKNDWNGEMHSVWKFAGNHGFYEGGEWQLDPLMYEAFDDDCKADWDEDYVLHEYAFYPHDAGEWVRTNIQSFFDLLKNVWYAQDDPNLKSVDFHASYVHTSVGEYRAHEFDEVEGVMWNRCLMPCDSFGFVRQRSDVEMLIYRHPVFDETRLSVEGSDSGKLFIGRLTSTWGTERRLAEKLPGDLQIWIRQPSGLKNIADYTEESFREALKEHVGLSAHEAEYLKTA